MAEGLAAVGREPLPFTEIDMDRWTAATAALAWLAGLVILGTRWHGVEVAPGRWQDAISLRQWAALWALLALLAWSVGGRLTRWPRRTMALLPLLAWIAWSLRAGTLGPVPMVIYGVPTLAAWCGGLLARDAWRR